MAFFGDTMLRNAVRGVISAVKATAKIVARPILTNELCTVYSAMIDYHLANPCTILET